MLCTLKERRPICRASQRIFSASLRRQRYSSVWRKWRLIPHLIVAGLYFLVRRYLSMDVIIPYVLWITFLGFAIDYLLQLIIKTR